MAYVTIPSTDALRQALYDMSAELWPSGIRIAPYHFRHSRAETLRASGWAAHEIAAVLGERSARTVAHYGRKTRPGSRTPPRVPIKRDGVRVPIAISPLPAFNPENLSRRFKPKSKLRWPQQMLDRFQEAVKSNICLGSLKEAAEMVPRLQACSCTNIAMLSLG